MKPINLKFCALFKINIQKREEFLIIKRTVFNFSLLYPKKSGLNEKSKVSSLDIRIKQSGFMVSKVPSSDQ